MTIYEQNRLIAEQYKRLYDLKDAITEAITTAQTLGDPDHDLRLALLLCEERIDKHLSTVKLQVSEAL